MDSADVTEWLNCDKLDPGHAILSEDEIMSSVLGTERFKEVASSDESTAESDSDDEKEEALSSLLELVLKYALKAEGGEEAVNILLQARTALQKLSI